MTNIRTPSPKKSRWATCAPVVISKLKEWQCFLQIWGYQLAIEPSCKLLKLHLLWWLTSGSMMIHTSSHLVKSHRICILFFLDLQEFHILKSKNAPMILASAMHVQLLYIRISKAKTACLQPYTNPAVKLESLCPFFPLIILLLLLLFSHPGLSQGFPI